MARRFVDVLITLPNRDKDKVYRVTELPADAGEWWADRFLLALARGGTTVPDGMLGAGMSGIAAMGFQVMPQMRTEDVKPLLDEMFLTIKKKESEAVIRPLIEGDIEEIHTRWRLRAEWWELHTGFSLPDAIRSRLGFPKDRPASSVTQTSPAL